jgi:hypothetical protein
VVEGLPDRAFDIVTRLPGWRVGDLAFHCFNRLQALPPVVASRPVLDVANYLSAMPCGIEVSPGDETSTATSTAALPDGAISPTQVKRRLRDAVGAFGAWLGDTDVDSCVGTQAGPMRAADFLVARCIEGAVHALDFAALDFAALDFAALDIPVAVRAAGPERDAVKVAVRGLLGVLVANAPGRSVEVRVPPVAAVQCVEGPRHTRGTPPNVVETDPITWIELAAGRLAWSAATDDGRVRASGERSDLRWLLPLL